MSARQLPEWIAYQSSMVSDHLLSSHSEHEHNGHAHVTPARSYGAVETAASQAVEAHSHGGHSHDDDDDQSSGLSGGGGHGHSHGSMNMQGVFLHGESGPLDAVVSLPDAQLKC